MITSPSRNDGVWPYWNVNTQTFTTKMSMALGQRLLNYLQMSIHPHSLWSVWPKPSSTSRASTAFCPDQYLPYRADRTSFGTARDRGTLSTISDRVWVVIPRTDIELAEKCVSVLWLQYNWYLKDSLQSSNTMQDKKFAPTFRRNVLSPSAQ